MTNTRRNTIVLASLLVVVSFVTSTALRSVRNKTEEMQKKNKLLQAQIIAIENQITNIDSLRKTYQLQKELHAQQSKLILEKDDSALTYNYLLKILNWSGLNLVFDFSPASTAKQANFNEYVISGRSNFRELLTFVNHMENQRALITLEDLSIGADNIAGSDTVSFSIVMRTHYTEGGTNHLDVSRKDISPVAAKYQIFRTRIADSAINKEAEPGLLSLDMVSLVGMTQRSVFLRDEQGVIKILSPGDKVAFGSLHSIHPKEGKAIFRIDVYGVLEEKTLFLRGTQK